MRRSPTVWRLALLWQGTVLDVVTLGRAHTRIALRTGERLKARVKGGVVELSGAYGPILVEEGVFTELPAGHGVVVTRGLGEAQVGTLSVVDATLFHAVMIGAAVQACLVSALVLTPPAVIDPEPGAGIPGEFRRHLVNSGGSALVQGRASFHVRGRAPDEAEKQPQIAKPAGQRPTQRGRGIRLEQQLDDIRRILQIGDDGVEMRQAIADIAKSIAQSPIHSAELGPGGLATKDPVQAGPGNGLIGVGESKLQELLRKQREEQANATRATFARRTALPDPIPVALLDVPDAHVTTVEAREELDPIVRDHLAVQVRLRHNSIRYCYESFGLPSHPKRSGRLVLEMSLNPDGRITDPVATTDPPELRLVGECVERMAGDWYLGDGLVDRPTRLSFPFVLQPRKDVTARE